MILEAISLLEYNYLYQIKDKPSIWYCGMSGKYLYRLSFYLTRSYFSYEIYEPFELGNEITIAFGMSGKYLSMHAIILCMGNHKGRYEHCF